MKKNNPIKRKPPKPAAKRNAEAREARLLTPEFLQGRTDEHESLLALERMLTRAAGFALAFARVNMPAQRTRLVQEIRRRIEPQGVMIIEVDFQAPVQDLLVELGHRLDAIYRSASKKQQRELAVAEGGPRFAVFVYGLEHSMPSSDYYHPALAVINYKRENFREQISAPLVLWLPEFALRAVAEGAPDFWAWRSGVFEFTAPPGETERARVLAPESGWVELTRMPEEEKRRRIHFLSGLLAEYESHERTKAPEVAAIRADLLLRLGMLNRFLGELDRGLAYYEKSLSIQREIGDRAGEGATLNNISQIYDARGDYATALKYLEDSLKIRREIGDRSGEGTTLNNISQIYDARGDYGKALEYLEKSLSIRREIGDPVGLIATLHNLAHLPLQTRNHKAALEEFTEALKLSVEAGRPYDIFDESISLGILYIQLGQKGQGRALLQQALEVGRQLGHPQIAQVEALLQKSR